MYSVCDYYGISGPVPFADVQLTFGNRLYLDPHAIRMAAVPRPFVDQAMECINTFAHESIADALAGAGARRTREAQLPQHFGPIQETRLGPSVMGHKSSKGIGTFIGRFRGAVVGDLQIMTQIGLMRQLEDFPLFISGIDRGITSDATARIVFEPLARFTRLMLSTYPEFSSTGHKVELCRQQIWSPSEREWVQTDLLLPITNGVPLLLIPHQWIRPTLLMSAGRYYETTVLTFVQHQQAVQKPDGTILRMPKDQISKLPGLGRGRDTNTRITLRAFDDFVDLVACFKSFVAARQSRTDLSRRNSR